MAAFLCSIILLSSCGSDNKKAGPGTDTKEQEAEVAPDNTDDGAVPAIDVSNLNDEASILDAMQKVVDARVADEKKKKENPSYKGHYLELTKLYTAVLKASTAYSKSMADPSKAVEFNNKVREIQRKMY